MIKTSAYWWLGNPRQPIMNFGDQLTRLLLPRFSELEVEWAPADQAKMVAVGSVIEALKSDFSGYVAGAGTLHEKTRINLPKAKILGLRGPLTAKGVKGDFALGDPGLLADHLVSVEKEHHLLVIPHWTDKDLVPKFTSGQFKKYKPIVVEPCEPPIKVIEAIGKARKVVTSSLHGAIIADAFGLPRRIEIAPRMLSHKHQEGGAHKWIDYHLSIGMKLEFGVTREAPRFHVVDRQNEVYDMLSELGDRIRNENS